MRSIVALIFLLFLVGLETNLEEMRQVGRDSLMVAFIGVALPFLLGVAATYLLASQVSDNTRLGIEMGVVDLSTVVHQAVAGFPIKVVAPCEGTGYEIGSMSIIDGARNEDEAKAFYDWALSSDAQNLALQVKACQEPVVPVRLQPASM